MVSVSQALCADQKVVKFTAKREKNMRHAFSEMLVLRAVLIKALRSTKKRNVLDCLHMLESNVINKRTENCSFYGLNLT